MSSSSPIQPEASTVAYWTLNESGVPLLNSGGSADHDLLTVTGSPTYQVDGYGKAIHGDTEDLAVELIDAKIATRTASTALALVPGTYEFIVKNYGWDSSFRTDSAYLFGNDIDSGGRKNMFIRFNEVGTAGKLNFVFNGNIQLSSLMTTAQSWLNHWLYVCCTVEKIGSAGYVQGNWGDLEFGSAIVTGPVGTTGSWTPGVASTVSYLGSWPLNDRRMDGDISTGHIMAERKSDAWIAQRFLDIQAWFPPPADGAIIPARSRATQSAGGVGNPALHKDANCEAIKKPTVRDCIEINSWRS